MSQSPVIVITGAGSGIGAAIARLLAGPQARLVLHTGRNAAALDAVAAEARAQGAHVIARTGDLADPATAPELIASARAAFGRVDQIVSNAGRAQKARFGEIGPDDLEAAFAMMPMAFFRLVDAALDDLAGPLGRVVAISSFVAHGYGTNAMLFPATAAAKAALESLAKSLAVQLGPTGATVNCIAPGFVRKDADAHAATSAAAMQAATAITPNGQLGTPDDIAETTRFLLSPAARHITGQVLHVDGGLLLP